MLLITRRPDEAIVINGEITVKVVDIRGGRVKLGFEFPSGNTVYREELFTKIQAENRAAAVGQTPVGPLADVLKKLPSTLSPTTRKNAHDPHSHDDDDGSNTDE